MTWKQHQKERHWANSKDTSKENVGVRAGDFKRNLFPRGKFLSPRSLLGLRKENLKQTVKTGNPPKVFSRSCPESRGICSLGRLLFGRGDEKKFLHPTKGDMYPSALRGENCNATKWKAGLRRGSSTGKGVRLRQKNLVGWG